MSRLAISFSNRSAFAVATCIFLDSMQTTEPTSPSRYLLKTVIYTNEKRSSSLLEESNNKKERSHDNFKHGKKGWMLRRYHQLKQGSDNNHLGCGIAYFFQTYQLHLKGGVNLKEKEENGKNAYLLMTIVHPIQERG